MPKPKTALQRNPHMVDVHALGRPDSSPPQTTWEQPADGWTAVPAIRSVTALCMPKAVAAPALAQGSGSNLVVTWSAPSTDSTHGAATTYNLRSSPSGAGTWTPVSSVASPYTLIGLIAGAAFDVEIQAVNSAGTAVWSPISTLTTAAAAPNTPAAPTLVRATGSNLTATWSAPATDASHSAASTYNLRSSPSGAGTWTTVSGVTSPNTLTGLIAGAAFDVQIQAVNTTGTSAWSPISTLTMAAAAPNTPAAPTLVRGTGSNLTATWSAPATDASHSAASTYNLRSSPSGAGTWTTVSGVTSPYTLTSLAAGSAYDVEVQAANTAGTTAWSLISTLTTASAAPNAPAAPSLAQGTGSNLTATWAAPATDASHNAATTYNLRSSPTGAGTWTTVSGVTSPSTLTGLAAGTAYDVEVQGGNLGGTGAWSAISTLTTAAAGPFVPNAPSVTSVAPPPDGTVTKLTVTWTVPATDGSHGAATGYNVRTSPTGAGTWTTVTNATNPCTVAGLTGATAIDVAVQATNAAGSGAWSVITTATTRGATVAPGNWVAASTQTHGASVSPNGGVNLFAVAAPTVVTGASFAWSTSNTVVPTTGLIVAGTNGQTNGWGQFFSAPATPGTYYLWLLAQGAGGTTGALVTSAITVT
jgi:hypothetical protein